MTQQPPQIHARLTIMGDVSRAIDTTADLPFEYYFTLEVGVKPTKASCDQGILTWEYAIPKEEHWELPETLQELLVPFKPSRIKPLLDKFELYAEAALACYITDSFPSLNFSPKLLEKLTQMGAHLDLDFYQKADAEHNRDLL